MNFLAFCVASPLPFSGQSKDAEDLTVLSQWTWSFMDVVEAESIEAALARVFVGYAGSLSDIRFSVEGGLVHGDVNDTDDEGISMGNAADSATTLSFGSPPDLYESRFVANAITGQVFCFPSREGVYLIQLWATDAADRRLLVWEWNMTATGFVIESANEYVPVGAESVMYEYWDDPNTPMRTQWEINATYHIAPINITNPSIGGTPVDPARIMFILDPTPPGYGVVAFPA